MKSTPSELRQLRADLIAVAADRCEWPGCRDAGEQMAHLKHRGMGGSVEANKIENVAWLCVPHHDMFDGRRHLTRFELRSLLGGYLIFKRGLDLDH